MTTDEKETKNTRKSKQPINEIKSPLLPEKHASEEFKWAPFAGAVFNLSTSIIGAGIMALPTTIKVLGLGLGLGMIVFVAVLTEASLEMLLRFSRVGKSESYGEVMGDAFGVVGRRLLQICILLNNVGTLIVYMIIIDSLRHTSALAIALAIVFLIITAGITILKLFNGSVAMPRLLPKVTDITSVWSLFTAVPVLVIAFICHFNVHTIDNELEDSSLIQPVVKTSLALCSIIYILTSFFGFLLFGDSTLDDILANFDANLGIPYSFLLNDVVRISYALHLMLVFPILLYPLRLNLDGLFFPTARPLVANNVRFGLISIGLLLLVFLGANFIPNIWDAFQFTGATATVCIGFIFPATIALRDPHAIATKKDKILSVFMVALAVFSNMVAIYSDAYTILKKNVNTNA
ncbi:amino acid transporter AVT6A-like isoform X5 [Carya illinoinensis]|uniref:amino acid transporter AVT6A-like isoform X5 n=1 Tax=Carya illinoinensis TaxID=32201 RepID=UPI001C729A34|nr:amino acid transporter AVT6A-like isoform X5 [Carya illinoinensis]